MDQNRQVPDDEIIRLLGRLKEAGPEYPAHLQAGRRAAILAGLALLPAAAGGLAAGGSWIAHLIKIVKAMSVIDKIILGVELVAVTGLTTYGAVNAYVYRNALRQLLFPSAAQTPFPTLSVPVASDTESATEALTPTPTPTGTLTLTVEPIQTVTPLRLPNTPRPATPVPHISPKPAQPTPTHGLHLGQTKTPKP
jgi:hypothetical protein